MVVLMVIFGLYGGVLFAALASFACVVSERAAHGESFLGGRSRCGCGRQLKASENIPLLGWLRVRGVARCCGARIPRRYVLAEAGGTGVGVLVGAGSIGALQAGASLFGVAAAVVAAVVGFVLAVVKATVPDA